MDGSGASSGEGCLVSLQTQEARFFLRAGVSVNRKQSGYSLTLGHCVPIGSVLGGLALLLFLYLAIFAKSH
jgi:hypothetical protein